MGWFTDKKADIPDDEYIFHLPKSHYLAHQEVLDKVDCSFGEVLIWSPNVSDFLACGGSERSDLGFRLSAICTHTPYNDFLKWDMHDAMKVVSKLSEYLQQAIPQSKTQRQKI